MGSYDLPSLDSRGFYSVFFSAVGGDGANMAAKLLFKLGVEKLGLNGGYDAKYGSEKKGTATDVSVRFCRLGTPVRFAGPANRKDLLACFHEGLIRPLAMEKGLRAGAFVLVNTTKTPAEIRDVVRLHSGRITCLDAGSIVKETSSRLNMPMLALAAHALGFPADLVKGAVVKTWPRAVEANVRAYDMTVARGVTAEFPDDGKYPLVEPSEERGKLGYLNMADGGAIDARCFSTVFRNNQVTGRGFVPEYDISACSGCALCLTVCSDPGGLLWDVETKTLKGIDMAFCKGCMRCVEVCPPSKKGHALSVPAGMVEA